MEREWGIAAAAVAAFFAPLLVGWLRSRRWGLPVTVCSDDDGPSADDMARWLAEIAVRLDERPERMRIDFRCAARDGRDVTLDLLPDGRMRVEVAGAPPRPFDLRRRWIADHPVPLSLRRRRLWVKPVDGNRFRVSDRLPLAVPTGVYVACSIAAAAGLAAMCPELVAAAAGAAAGAVLASR